MKELLALALERGSINSTSAPTSKVHRSVILGHGPTSSLIASPKAYQSVRVHLQEPTPASLLPQAMIKS